MTSFLGLDDSKRTLETEALAFKYYSGTLSQFISLTFLYSHYTMGSQPEVHVIIVGGGIAGLATVTYQLPAYTDCENLS